MFIVNNGKPTPLFLLNIHISSLHTESYNQPNNEYINQGHMIRTFIYFWYNILCSLDFIKLTAYLDITAGCLEA